MKKHSKILAVLILCLTQLIHMTAFAADISNLASESKLPLVLTMGADLSADQRNLVMKFFGVDTNEAQEMTITNKDEREHLGGLISDEQIGTRTFSCSLVNPTNLGGIQVKTANLNYVTSNMIASQLLTSGVYNCEVLTAAPFEVSGTGALTGVMMAYEEASGVTLDDQKKALANEELVTTGSIAENVGQDEATLMVNDIKIHIIRDDITEEQEVHDVVDEVIETTGNAATEAAKAHGTKAPAPIGDTSRKALHDFAVKFSKMDYDYAQVQPTLERVTYNVTVNSGIKDPIVDTFTTISEDVVLPSNSILRRTVDDVWGDDAIINATNDLVVAEKPAEPINIITDNITLTSAGGVKADEFIKGTNIISYKDINGSYALMDLNGNILTESIYDRYLYGRKGFITAQLSDGSKKAGILAPDGSVIVEFKYDQVKVLDKMWAIGTVLTKAGDKDDYDYSDGSDYYQVEYCDLYYIGQQGSVCVATLSREEIEDAACLADYINIQAKDGTITTYDSTFTPVKTPENLYTFNELDPDYGLSDSVGKNSGYTVGSFHGKYAMAYKGGEKGMIDRYANIIVPPRSGSFDYVFNSDTHAENYENGGYFFVSDNNKLEFVTAGGTVTASIEYDSEKQSYRNAGMSVILKDREQGNIVMLSGDGVKTELGSEYEYISAITETKGMFWIAEKDRRYNLIDWHGNTLISGSAGISVSANGKYLISQDGYTSSTLYMINDAEPVDLANSAGGAKELQIEKTQTASLELYSGNPTLKSVGTTKGERFITDSNLMTTRDDEKLTVIDLDGNSFSEPVQFQSPMAKNGYISLTSFKTKKCGVITEQEQLVVPFAYDYIEILSEKWIIAYELSPGTEENYDVYKWGSSDLEYFMIDKAVIYYVGDSDTRTLELTRDQYNDASAQGDYLNIEDRATGNVVTYDSDFNALASVRSIYDFGSFDMEKVQMKQLKDQTGYDIYGMYDDGYIVACERNNDTGEYLKGVLNGDGEEILPFIYDRLDYVNEGYNFYICNHGYFCVAVDEKCGYVSKGGEVTCEIKYDEDSFINEGISAKYKKSDGTYLVVAADGTESGPYDNIPSIRAKGMLYFVFDNSLRKDILYDWHGNVLLEDYRDFSFSADGQYMIARKDTKSPFEVFRIEP